MRLIIYRTELDKNLHNILIKEKSCNYPSATGTLMNPGAVTEMLNTVFRLNRQAEEHVYLLALNTKGRLLGVFELSHGTVNLSICNPRDVFIKALLCGASAIILAHNHPSGDTTPSENDFAIYRKIKELGELLGVDLLDSIIIGDSYYSFHENQI